MNRIKIPSMESIISKATAALHAAKSANTMSASSSSPNPADGSSSSSAHYNTSASKGLKLPSQLACEAAMASGKVDKHCHPLLLNLLTGPGAYAKLPRLQQLTLKFRFPPTTVSLDAALDDASVVASAAVDPLNINKEMFSHPAERNLRFFQATVIPRLAYHNPHIKFTIQEADSDSSSASSSAPTVILKDMDDKVTVLENLENWDEMELLSHLENTYL